ncbi:integrase/recombinase XerD [Bradyrhizobium diazoefficiens]|jgi:site-specific recombinase XerD|uniref:Site-specific integrase n=1 Tax=Bradyrhizobium barranii subsp. barranii TaxID=2823807 RepID=A0A7Z0QKS4_9BRAD|nr:MULTISPECIES: tyrosine-type recombinase/integrase [Bradyrhizobium]MBP2435158.1 site-specific recombinase XerD [Bradyrhizobium elkanii]MBR0867907.1 tyrosine-type recombinase/integrase [Bradyrhizobium diazoefficiens]MBR0893038.1 tyrosine-type recombinase/integrase [Bradyrhizobium diazoefficiens]MBR0924720.1 tyrosine-type recombinase/integrase [Bradyrhizobium diazoefficiens]MBR1004920.1 tyrosine-type recombinase/integrase [Bradyrhizobium liaoningense]
MRSQRPNELGKSIERFFREYLPTLRGTSRHTIRNYRDALVLFLRFTSSQTAKAIEDLDLVDFTAKQVQDFLAFLEAERHNGVATRNARLAALHTFSRFLATEQPAYLAELQRVLGVPFKRGARSKPIEYLEPQEVEALLKSIDRSTERGKRDYALFALMLNTGARVQEILDLRLCDIRTDPPHQIRLRGKGDKTRLCPIWPQTARLLQELSNSAAHSGGRDAPLFVNRQGSKLTRFGVRYLLKKHITAGANATRTLQQKRIHPHSLRHTTAIFLLKAGVDFATISQWLGHSSLNTTMTYARADIDLKRQALMQVFPEILAPPRAGHVSSAAINIVDWLKRL